VLQGLFRETLLLGEHSDLSLHPLFVRQLARHRLILSTLLQDRLVLL
jgi:hypothetical protein